MWLCVYFIQQSTDFSQYIVRVVFEGNSLHNMHVNVFLLAKLMEIDMSYISIYFGSKGHSTYNFAL